MELGAAPALVAGMLMLGLGGLPHCAAMCGMPCAPWLGAQGGARGLAFLGGRTVGYALGGALLAGGAAHLGQAAATWRVVQPLWLAWHLLALGWGLVLLLRGAQPAWLSRAVAPVGAASASAGGWQPLVQLQPAAAGTTAPAVLAGLAWVAWPCGLLQSALLLASLANGAAAGAGLMAFFALVTSAGLWVAPALWRRWAGHDRLMLRLAGVALVGSSAWALARHTGFVDWCLSPR